MRHSQYTANPLNPPYQGDFEDFARVGVIGRCLLIYLIHHSSPVGGISESRLPTILQTMALCSVSTVIALMNQHSPSGAECV